MSLRLQYVIASVVFFVLVIAWFFLGFNPNRSKIDDLVTQQEQVQNEIEELRLRLARLQELQRQEPQLRAELTRMRDALPSDPRLPDFILQVQEAANLAGIDFLSITPSVPAAFTPAAGAAPPGGGTLQAITLSISTSGRYFAIEDFVIRMERLRRAVRINAFALAPGGDAEGDTPGGSPTMAVTFAMQMFVLSPAPVAAGGAATPAPQATPAPGATPAPSPAGSPTPTPGAG